MDNDVGEIVLRDTGTRPPARRGPAPGKSQQQAVSSEKPQRNARRGKKSSDKRREGFTERVNQEVPVHSKSSVIGVVTKVVAVPINVAPLADFSSRVYRRVKIEVQPWYQELPIGEEDFVRCMFAIVRAKIVYAHRLIVTPPKGWPQIELSTRVLKQVEKHSQHLPLPLAEYVDTVGNFQLGMVKFMPFYDLLKTEKHWKHLDPYCQREPEFPPARLPEFGDLCEILRRFGVTTEVSLYHGEGRPGQAVQLSDMDTGSAWSALNTPDSAFTSVWTGLGLRLARQHRRPSFIRTSSVDDCQMWAAVDPDTMQIEQVNRMKFNSISGK